MLNISDKSIQREIKQDEFKSFKQVTNKQKYRRISRIIFFVVIFCILCLFLPWTQNVSTSGYVTSLRPEQRPQIVVANIPGRIDKWHVQEGQLVKRGDPIISLSEVKSEYLDSNQVLRIKEQVIAKGQSIESYQLKVEALDGQRSAMKRGLGLKLKQAKNKLIQAKLIAGADSSNAAASKVILDNTKDLVARSQRLYDQDLISKSKWQEVLAKEQKAQAEYTGKQNKFQASLNKLINAEIELSSINVTYSEKLAKNKSDRSSAASSLADAYSKLSELKNKLGNVEKRGQYRIVTAPQDGYITKAMKTGIGAVVKEGEGLVTILPKEHDLAAEVYVSAIDLPLMSMHHEVNLIFDGWPVIAVAGWPDASYGTFKGEIVAIDNMISKNGKYRILVSPKKGTKEWPVALRLGSGVRGFALLNNVPIYREVWRQMNGFPPDFYADHKDDHVVKDRKKKNKDKKE